MRRGSSVGVILLLVLGFLAAPAYSQTTGAGASDARERGFRLDQAYPNPLNPATRIPFYLDEDLFEDGRPVLVTIRIYNVLHQLIAVPTALNHPSRPGVPVEALEYTTAGGHEVYWDGTFSNGQKVPSGQYLVQMTVHGYRPQIRRITVAN